MRVRVAVTFETRIEGSEELWLAMKGLIKVAGRRFDMHCVDIGDEQIVAAAVRKAPRDLVEGGCPGWRSRSGQGKFWCEGRR